MNFLLRIGVISLLLGAAISAPARADADAPSPEQIAQWSEQLQSDSALTRRAAARQLLRAGVPALPVLIQAADHADTMVRRIAAIGLARFVASSPPPDGSGHLAALQALLADPDWPVRLAAVQAMAGQSPRPPVIDDLLQQAAEDQAPQVRQAAIEAIWPYTARPQAVRDRPDLDYDLRLARELPLPATGWKFRLDPAQQGHRHRWFEPDFDDRAWEDFQIEKVWGDQGHPGYSGVAWYRLSLPLPEAPPLDGVDLVLHGVDNSAWVWLNGRFIAAHDIGPAGWNRVVRMDVTSDLKWGEENQITVRVRNGPYAGGIYKPVVLEVLHRQSNP